MTHKTGNFKSFFVFVKMLSTALSRDTNSVFLDLLTYADLQMFQVRKRGSQDPPPEPNPKNKNKRYVILTYVVEFDRVHYPLPLVFESNPDPQILKNTIRRLRAEIEALKSQGTPSAEQLHGDMLALVEENKRLKAALQHLEQQRAAGEADTIRALEQEVKNLRSKLESRLEDSYGGGPSDSFSVGSGGAESINARLRDLEREVLDLTDALKEEKSLNRKVLMKHRKEKQLLAEEVQQHAESEKKFRIECRKLKAELEALSGDVRSYTSGGTRTVSTNRSSPTNRSSSLNRSSSTNRSGSTSKTRTGSKPVSRTSSKPASRSSSRPSSKPSSRSSSRNRSSTAASRDSARPSTSRTRGTFSESSRKYSSGGLSPRSSPRSSPLSRPLSSRSSLPSRSSPSLRPSSSYKPVRADSPRLGGVSRGRESPKLKRGDR